VGALSLLLLQCFVDNCLSLRPFSLDTMLSVRRSFSLDTM
jgi:hypothetical protein